MKRILVLILGVLILAGVGSITTVVPANAQTYYTTLLDVLNYSKFKLDSLATLLSAPPPVAVTTYALFAGITMEGGVAGSATNLKSGHRTFPVTMGPCLDGVKSAELIISYADWEHGGFTVEHIFSSSATDTTAIFFGGTLASALIPADTICLADTLSKLPAAMTPIAGGDVPGTFVLRIPYIPANGYYFCRITPWAAGHANWITGLAGSLRVVE